MAEQTTKFQSVKDVPASAWKNLAQKRIYFGHRSVGFNILDGVKDLMEEYPQIHLKIVETTDPSEFATPVLGHFRVGENGKPLSKIRHFSEVVDGGIGDRVDIAFLKFCFVDITMDTNIEEIFSHYKETMSRLRDKYPTTIFVHVTVPLTYTKPTWKTWMKKILRKEKIWEYDHNMARTEFNNKLRKTYSETEPFFDLAKIESIYPDGKRASFVRAGKNGYFLVPEYTHDGGHLNETGRKLVAEQLLIFLANLPSQK